VLLNLVRCDKGANAFLEKLGRCGIYNGGRLRVDWVADTAAAVWFVRANAFEELLVVHSPDSNVAVVGRCGQHGAGNIPSDFPHRAVIVVELSCLRDFKSRASRFHDWLQVENADVFGRDCKHVVASADIRCKLNRVNGFSDWQIFRLCPASIELTVLEDKHFRLIRICYIARCCNHGCMCTKQRWIPAERRERQFAHDFMLERPLGEVTDIGRLVDSYNSI
jgi:hypothetical protein